VELATGSLSCRTLDWALERLGEQRVRIFAERACNRGEVRALDAQSAVLYAAYKGLCASQAGGELLLRQIRCDARLDKQFACSSIKLKVERN
jgi:hypothetical protein